MTTGEIHDLYDSILILDFGSQVCSAYCRRRAELISSTRISSPDDAVN